MKKLLCLSVLSICVSSFAGEFRIGIQEIAFGPMSAPSCGTGEYFFFLDSAELKFKKCVNGSVSDLDTTGAGGDHGLLSATHTDTTAGAVARGDLVTGQTASPKWQRLALGSTGRYLRSDGTDLGYSSVAAAGAGGCTNQFPRALNDNAAPTCSDVTAADFASQAANTALIAPDAAAGEPAFRLLAASDIPSLGAAKIASGVFAAARLGSGTADATVFLRGDSQWAAPPDGSWTLVAKTSDQSTSSDTTLNNDDALTFSVAANTKYEFRAAVFFDSQSIRRLAARTLR